MGSQKTYAHTLKRSTFPKRKSFITYFHFINWYFNCDNQHEHILLLLRDSILFSFIFQLRQRCRDQQVIILTWYCSKSPTPPIPSRTAFLLSHFHCSLDYVCEIVPESRGKLFRYYAPTYTYTHPNQMERLVFRLSHNTSFFRINFIYFCIISGGKISVTSSQIILGKWFFNC